MTETFKRNRVKFTKKGAQMSYILKAEKTLRLTELELAKKLKVSHRTIREWKKERITMSQIAAIHLSKLAKLKIPKEHIIIDWRMHLQNAGKIGSRITMTRYGSVGGDIQYRKDRWRQWWKEVGQYKKPAQGFKTLTKIKIPRKSKLLAEFFGIMLGDGGISKYHSSVTLSNTEKQYILFVSKMIYGLFGIRPKIYKLTYAHATDIVVNSKLFGDFCQGIGLVKGNKIKQQIDIPEWIKDNRKFSIACIRGLVDTDGCFYINSYYSNGKKYFYFKIAFTSASIPLIDSVFKTLINFGINARISKNHKDVRIESNQYVAKYIKEIGSHNQKHLDKIEKWKVALNGKAAVC